jgi:hypothetical protein
MDEVFLTIKGEHHYLWRIEALVLHGPPARCRDQLAVFRAAGIQLPIIRPVPVGHQSYIQALRMAIKTFT